MNFEKPNLEGQEEQEADWAKAARLEAESAEEARNNELEEINKSAEEAARKKLEGFAIDKLTGVYAEIGYAGVVPKTAVDSFIDAMSVEQKKKILLEGE